MITGIEVNQPTKINRIATGECLLSISLLVSNQKRTIRKCMESIRPLLEQVPSELVVVDTVGEENSDGSLAIAREYADKIVHFTWCDDFAAARNAGLEQCQGKWFMFLDDDEYYDDVTPLIDFFHNPEYLAKYYSINVKGRNYESYEGTKYSDRNTLRIFKRTPEGRFIGKVHEYYAPAYTPMYDTDAYVHHFGYIYVEDKIDRNEVILLQMIEENPLNYSAWLQLIIGYSNSEVYKKIQLAKQALGKIDHPDQVPSSEAKPFAEVVINLIDYYKMIGNYTAIEQLYQTYADFFKADIFRNGLFNYMHMVTDLAQYQLANCLGYFKNYQEIVAYFELHPEEYGSKYTPFFKNYMQKDHYNKTLSSLIESLFKYKQYTLLLDLTQLLDWSLVAIKKQEVIACLVRTAYYTKSNKLLCQLLQYCEHNDLVAEWVAACQLFLFKLKETEQKEFRTMIAAIDSDQLCVCYNKLLLDQSETLLVQMTKKVTYYEAGVEDYLIALIKQGKSPLSIFETANLGEIQTFTKFVDLYFEGDFNEEAKFIEQLAASLDGTVIGTYLVYQLFKQMLLKPSMTTMELENYLESYLFSGQQLVVQLYSEQTFTKEAMLLPNEFHWLAILGQALNCRENGQLVEYLQLLKQGLQIYPEAKELIEKLMTLAQRELRKQQSVTEELARLADKVKADILKLISEQKIAEAKKVYDELLQIVPADESLVLIQKYLE